MNKLLFYLGVLFILGCTNQDRSIASLQNEKKILVEAAKATSHFIKVIETNNIPAIKECFDTSENFRLILSGDAYTSKSFKEMADNMLPNVDHQIMDTKKEIYTIIGKDCFIHYWTGFNGMYFKDGTSMEINKFYMTYIYKKIDEKWKIIHAHESWMPESPEENISPE
nr:nuclear transport factor 2 family protein [uncultured Carboxylicivirga sp.]